MSTHLLRQLIIFIVVWPLLAVLALPEQPAASPGELGPVPQQGLLMLRNGEVLEGKISRAGDLYFLVLPNGQIRVKTSEVEFCCRTLDEAYRQKRSAIRVGSVQDHLELARWCQRHGQLSSAARELADATAADPTNPMIPHLERRLRLSLQPLVTTGRRIGPVEQVSAAEQMERLVRAVPPGSIETFTRTIQPLLLNNCTASGCHGPGSTADFRLLRIHAGTRASRRTTLRNLEAVLGTINREQPQASPLLTAPIRPHGTAKTAIFGTHHVRQYKQLVDWVYGLSKIKVAEQRVPLEKVDAGEKRAAADPAGLKTESRAETEQPDTCPKVKRGQPPQRFVPVDQFDPEIFNRRFFPKKQEQDSPAQ